MQGVPSYYMTWLEKALMSRSTNEASNICDKVTKKTQNTNKQTKKKK